MQLRQTSPTLADLSLGQLQWITQLLRQAIHRRQELDAIAQQLARLAIAPTCSAIADLRGRETLLVADDQVVVRALTRHVLERFGYRVLVSGAGLREWSCFDRIDLILLDVPAWSEGQRERVRLARRLAPRLIVSTPLPEGPARAHLREAGADAFIDKPFHPPILGQCVRRLLNAKAASG